MQKEKKTQIGKKASTASVDTVGLHGHGLDHPI